MISAVTLDKDVHGCIADWPVTIRHYTTQSAYYQITAGLNPTDDVSTLLEGGLLDNPRVDIIAATIDLQRRPEPRDRVDVLQSDGVTWERFEVKRVSTLPDPMSRHMLFTLGSPNI